MIFIVKSIILIILIWCHLIHRDDIRVVSCTSAWTAYAVCLFREWEGVETLFRMGKKPPICVIVHKAQMLSQVYSSLAICMEARGCAHIWTLSQKKM